MPRPRKFRNTSSNVGKAKCGSAILYQSRAKKALDGAVTARENAEKRHAEQSELYNRYVNKQSEIIEKACTVFRDNYTNELKSLKKEYEERIKRLKDSYENTVLTMRGVNIVYANTQKDCIRRELKRMEWVIENAKENEQIAAALHDKSVMRCKKIVRSMKRQKPACESTLK